MEINESVASMSFGKRNGCHVSKGVALLLGVLFLAPHGVAAMPGNDSQTLAARARGARSSPLSASTTLFTTTKVNDFRLPTALKPLHYTVRLQPFIRGNFSIMGYVEVEVEVVEETSTFTFHMADITTHNDSVKIVDSEKRNGKGVHILKQTYDNQQEFYHAHLSRPLKKGRRYLLSMAFQGYLNEHLHGFYRSSYKVANGDERWVAVTQFQPTDARKAFPCFDEPAMKATFEIFLARETDMSAISNMPRIDSQPVEGQEGWVWDHFNTSVPMPTYLVAFLVSDFKSMEATTQNGKTFRVWAREDAISQANYSLKIGADILTFFEDFFSIPYPLPKQDMVAIPDFPLGHGELGPNHLPGDCYAIRPNSICGGQ
ncbi:Endoplasmic reticulum aminopeptidase 1 [Chionoecetes opilio]|uniref:Endoplasmic reticulum aminopeptidase 1 n=1 Tax=Chionoecetes opilio TaxID=41210 RepID=A0A8J5D122_CHIOP|nr:Endoplasmic reticulum aminopeptidase 1 [Chionoecetes opilio]